MDKFQALHTFWSGFGLPAYDENSVPTGDSRPACPYITYDAVVSNLGTPSAMSASLWYYGASWEQPSAKLAEIAAGIGRGGKILPCDGGALWIKQGSPFAQRMPDENDMIRRYFINIEAEFFTAD